MRSIESEQPARADEHRPWRRHYLILMGVAFALFAVGCIVFRPDLRFGRDLWSVVGNEATLEALIAQLGWLGPLALVLLNALQIVIAPIPGYFMQLAAGYLYGPIWGGIWGSAGLLAGTMLAMWLARIFGRPLVTRLAGAARLQRWERVVHSDSTWLWLFLILMPTGDLPYFLAGLSRVRYRTIFLLTLCIRVPTTFVVAAAGAGILVLSGPQLVAVVIGLVLVLLLFLRYQAQLTAWIDAVVARRTQAHNNRHPGDAADLPPTGDWIYDNE
ncbi:MAG: TVP38/TMEM64 family protein [Caldilineaceae bacterium]|nr:TVP38/TMEM64 family protein [Caldilineaceae bacterium]